MIKSRSTAMPTLLLMLVMAHPLHAQSSLADSLSQDTALQDSAIILMRSALGARDQSSVVRRGDFRHEIKFYIDTYRELRNANTLAHIQERYRSTKANLLEPRLPATVEELVSILEIL